MNNGSFFLSGAIAALVGVFHRFFLLFCFVYIAAYSPVPRFFADAGLTGWTFRLANFSVDFSTHVLLSFPAAFVLSKLRPANTLLYFAAALLPSFLYFNSVWIGHPMFGQIWPTLLTGWFTELMALPTAFFILMQLRNRIQQRFRARKGL